VPTSDRRGSFSLTIREAFKIRQGAGKEDGYPQCRFLTSTVLPGSTRQALLPILEIRQKTGRDFGLLLALNLSRSEVCCDFLNPIYAGGELDEENARSSRAIYSRVMKQIRHRQRG